jgi:hypothetical protein
VYVYVCVCMCVCVCVSVCVYMCECLFLTLPHGQIFDVDVALGLEHVICVSRNIVHHTEPHFGTICQLLQDAVLALPASRALRLGRQFVLKVMLAAVHLSACARRPDALPLYSGPLRAK